MFKKKIFSPLRPLFLGLLALGMAQPALSEPMPFADQIREATLVVSGTIVKREEIWDRRSNSLMGRPDFLKEIRFHLGSLRVHEGRLPSGTSQITLSVKGQKSLMAFRTLTEGMSGKFFLAGEAMPYELVEVKSLVQPKTTPKPVLRPATRVTPAAKLEFPENTGGRAIRASKELQKKAVRVISRRYGMTEARVVFLTSFSGPMPPQGGYLYWGVAGKIKGKWHIWQPGYKGVQPGDEPTDPKQYQK